MPSVDAKTLSGPQNQPMAMVATFRRSDSAPMGCGGHGWPGGIGPSPSSVRGSDFRGAAAAGAAMASTTLRDTLVAQVVVDDEGPLLVELGHAAVAEDALEA
jgi:hypothetical protein